LKEFIIDNRFLITYFFEIIAALSGSYYLKKVKDNRLRIFVYYLWLTVIVEIVGSYGYVMQYNFDSEWFIAIKNSQFCYNTWLYNTYAFLAIGLIGIFYSNFMSTTKTRAAILSIFVIYSLFSILFFTFTDSFFKKSIPYDIIIGASIICFYVVLYFLELIKSDKILKFYELPSFYISIGLLIWYLCVSPLFIFNSYFNSISSDFGVFRILLLLFINIFTYSCFAFGFLYPLRKNKL